MSLLTPNSPTPLSAAKEAAIFLERQRATAVWITQMDRLGMSNSAFVPDEETRRGLGAGEATTAVYCSTPGYGVEGVNSNVMRSYVLEARAHRPLPPQPSPKDNKTGKQTTKQTPPSTPPPQQQEEQNQIQSELPVAADAKQSMEPTDTYNSGIRVQRVLNKRELAAEKERARGLATEDDRVAVVGEHAIEVPTVVVLKEPLGPTYLPDVNPPPSGSICTKL